ncbi:MAG: hypothetical protein KatS3mg110_1767 [Pirellulaceae bacterium]|nr:MAG: hypothetical protein KatS3mg110_1767 [Pirellulaceae bacterium]
MKRGKIIDDYFHNHFFYRVPSLSAPGVELVPHAGTSHGAQKPLRIVDYLAPAAEKAPGARLAGSSPCGIDIRIPNGLAGDKEKR